MIFASLVHNWHLSLLLGAMFKRGAFLCLPIKYEESAFWVKQLSGILVLWLLVGYWWDEVQNRWDPSHFMPSQTPTNHPSQFFWHCHNSVPKWKVSNKIIFERIIESKSFILNRNLAFICQLFGNWQGESVKKRIFYGQADRKGVEGGQPPRPWP